MISEIVLRSFRGIPDERRFPLKQITFISGRNGLGKTTFFDAIDWCLFGDSSRLGDDADSLRNLYSPSSPPSVELALSLGLSEIRLTRRLDGSLSTLLVNGEETSDRDFLDLFIADRTVFPPHSRATPSRIRDLLYLEQARIRALVAAENEESRTELFQALLGVPHVATVRASFRKIADTIAARHRKLHDQLQALDSELAGRDLADTPGLASDVATLTSGIQTQVKDVFGDHFAFPRLFALGLLSSHNSPAEDRRSDVSTSVTSHPYCCPPRTSPKR